MVPPAPSRNFEQNSPITTILRQICESYPESSCLRELLQNADDAQASEIEYVLDTNTYDDLPLISPKLQAYHGPALLIKNNQVFADADFESLASIGDSRKRDDPASTGKYGQGFNSCFHWTDGPWILSRQWLLILDPHREWSKDCGGPTYNILDFQDSPEMRNHLKTFQRAEVDTSQAVNATVIRIPLRTEAQAKTSKIVSRQATIEEITKALSDLGQEVKEGGTLFLRHVRRVTVKIDKDVLWEACTAGVTEEDTKIMQSIPTTFTQLYASKSSEQQADRTDEGYQSLIAQTASETPPSVAETIHKSLHVNITYVEGPTSTVHRFFLQHNMSRFAEDNALNTWARKRKLFPWVALAAPLDHVLSRGRLFSCLRLPIETGQPVHIHGLFSIVPDRGRLSSSGQTSRDSGSDWNRFMFENCVVAAWADLLLIRSHVAWQQDLFKLWPRLNPAHNGELWSSLDDSVIDRLITCNLPVWNTPFDCLSFENGFFVPKGDITQLYGDALHATQLPLVCLEVPMYQKLLQRASGLSKGVRLLSPDSLRLFLQGNNQLQQAKNYSPLLLEYCVLDFIGSVADMEKQSQLRNKFRNISLWPTLQMSLTALGDHSFLLPRSMEESALFSTSRDYETLDRGRLTTPVVQLLEKYIKRGSKWVRHRTISDLEHDWTQIYSLNLTNTHSEICARNNQKDELLRRIWSWLCARCEEEGKSPLLSMHALDNLFLIPLNGSRIRKFVCSETATPTLVLEQTDWLYQLLHDNDTINISLTNSMLDTSILLNEAVKLLLSVAPQRADLVFATSSDLKGVIAWLAANKKFICELPSCHKEILTRKLDIMTLEQGPALLDAAKQCLRQHMLQLPFWSRVTATAPYK
ncbi:MAG: hypothetical protein Q9213_003291 [Squamulea squamosa]